MFQGDTVSPGRDVVARMAWKEDRHFVTALARGLAILSCFKSQHETLGNLELSRRCSLPKSTVSRLTHTLTALGYLVAAPGSKYQLGEAALAIGRREAV